MQNNTRICHIHTVLDLRHKPRRQQEETHMSGKSLKNGAT